MEVKQLGMTIPNWRDKLNQMFQLRTWMYFMCALSLGLLSITTLVNETIKANTECKIKLDYKKPLNATQLRHNT